MNELYQLVYTSIRDSKCTEEEVNKILKACQRNNNPSEVTGVLLHSKKRFIQYLEGGMEISQLYNKIKRDKRHHHVVLLSYMPIPERVFPNWQMGYKDIDILSFNTKITAEDSDSFNAIINGETSELNIGITLLKRFFEKA